MNNTGSKKNLPIEPVDSNQFNNSGVSLYCKGSLPIYGWRLYSWKPCYIRVSGILEPLKVLIPDTGMLKNRRYGANYDLVFGEPRRQPNLPFGTV